MSTRKGLILIILLVVLAIWVSTPVLPIPGNIPFIKDGEGKAVAWSALTGRFPLRLGLDLQGGTQLVLLADTSKIDQTAIDDAMESARDVLERRVNLFGVSEALVQTSKTSNQRRILVDLPGVQDASAAAALVGKTAQLDFREEPATFSAEATQAAFLQIYEYVPTGLTGADLKRAKVVFNASQDQTAGPQVSLEFNADGTKKFADITKRNVGKPLAIFLDDQPVTYPPPTIRTEIIDGNAIISGGFTSATAKNLATQLNAGALPLPISVLEQRSIGASLGQSSIEKSLVAGVIGLTLLSFYMIAYYGFYGLLATGALLIYTLLVAAIFRVGNFTLTLAGIAGFILSIGMAVDANILIFERMKEERRHLTSKKAILEQGFARAWSSIRDSNMSSLLTASILYFIGTGLVKGFAVTFAIGVLVSMFTAIFVTKTLLKLVTKG